MREQRLLGITYHDVVLYALLQREWLRDAAGQQ
jgi:hypothetical protein